MGKFQPDDPPSDLLGLPRIVSDATDIAWIMEEVDFVALVRAVLDEEAARRKRGRSDHCIVLRSDHGHPLLSDIGRGTILAIL